MISISLVVHLDTDNPVQAYHDLLKQMEETDLDWETYDPDGGEIHAWSKDDQLLSKADVDHARATVFKMIEESPSGTLS